MGKVIFTCGYGNRTPDEFVKLLKDAGVKTVIDVRYYEKARLGCYRATGYQDRGMAALLAGKPDEPVAEGIEYMWAQELGKPKEMPLAEYPVLVLGTTEGKKHIGLVKWTIERRENVCLLCAEGNAFTGNFSYRSKKRIAEASIHSMIRCHRIYVGQVLVRELGDGWEISHL